MRRNTANVLGSWMAGHRETAYRAISTDGQRIFSYDTCILEREPDGRVLLNMTRYSVTTSQQQNHIASYVGYALHVTGVPRGAQSLTPYAVACGENQGHQDALNTERAS